MTSSEPKKRGCGKTLLIIIVVLMLACIVTGVIAFAVAGPAIANIFNAFAAPIGANNDFMNALIAKDYTKAYGMVHPSQQASFGGSAEGMKQLFTDNGWQPTKFTFTNVQVGTDALVNGTGSFPAGAKYVYVFLRKDGETWKVIGIEINDNAPTATPAS